MIIKSNRKASGSIEVKLQNIDGSSYLIERKDHIKYLGVMIILALVSHQTLVLFQN